MEIGWKSLINLNQCRNFGIQICDDPTDPQIDMVIETSEDLSVPMTMEVSTCGIFTHPTTNNELYERQKIILLDEFDWDP